MIMLKVILVSLSLFSYISFAQDTLCLSGCKQEVFEIASITEKSEKRIFGTRVFYMHNNRIIDYVDYNKKRKALRISSKRIKSKNSVEYCNMLDSIKRKCLYNPVTKNREGFWVDSNVLYTHGYFTDDVLVGIGKYLDGKKDGKWLYFRQFSKDKYACVNYSEDKVTGNIELFSKGHLMGRIPYSNNCRNGKYNLFYFSGKLSETGEYNCDQLEYLIGFKKNGKVLITR